MRLFGYEAFHMVPCLSETNAQRSKMQIVIFETESNKVVMENVPTIFQVRPVWTLLQSLIVSAWSQDRSIL